MFVLSHRTGRRRRGGGARKEGDRGKSHNLHTDGGEKSVGSAENGSDCGLKCFWAPLGAPVHFRAPHQAGPGRTEAGRKILLFLTKCFWLQSGALLGSPGHPSLPYLLWPSRNSPGVTCTHLFSTFAPHSTSLHLSDHFLHIHVHTCPKNGPGPSAFVSWTQALKIDSGRPKSLQDALRAAQDTPRPCQYAPK